MEIPVSECVLCHEPVTPEDHVIGVDLREAPVDQLPPIMRQMMTETGLTPPPIITGYKLGEAVRLADGLMHVECAVRSVLGGIGHHEDHSYWCDNVHDDDAGLSYRESSRRVWALFIGGVLNAGGSDD